MQPVAFGSQRYTGELYLAGGLNLLKVLPESKSRLALPPCQILAEAGLGPIRYPLAHGFELTGLGLPIRNCGFHNVLKAVFWKKEDTVRIADDEVVGRNSVSSDRSPA